MQELSIEQAFSIFDNGTGHITRSQFNHIIDIACDKSMQFSYKDKDELIDYIDQVDDNFFKVLIYNYFLKNKDKNGTIELNEFRAIFETVKNNPFKSAS